MIELVPIAGHLYQHQVWYTSQAEHKPSVRATTERQIIQNFLVS
jgi:hypothetical protein